MAMARMRTVKQCLEYFKLGDPDSCISEHYLRMLVKSGDIPVFKAGAKHLINLDKLIQYLNSEPLGSEIQINEVGMIRKVAE